MNGPPQKPTTACSSSSSRRTIRIASRSDGTASSAAGHAEALGVGPRRDRVLDHGADPLADLHVEPHAEHRQHDVREDHRGVDAVAANGLQRHLCAELGVADEVEERPAGAERAVLGQRPARLTHEPDGRALDRFAPRGADEERIHATYTSGRPWPRPSREAPSRCGGTASTSGGASGLRAPRPPSSSRTPGRPRGARAARRACSSPTTGSTTSPTRSSGTASAARCRSRSRPGERRRLPLRLRGPMPPGRYRLAVDLVEEFRFWFADVGNTPLTVDVDVLPRIERRLAVRGGDAAALAAQDEAFVAEAEADGDRPPRPHGAAPAAGLVAPRARRPPGGVRGRRRRSRRTAAAASGADAAELRPWAPGGGRQPRFPHPLLCPSLVRGRRRRMGRRGRRTARAAPVRRASRGSSTAGSSSRPRWTPGPLLTGSSSRSRLRLDPPRWQAEPDRGTGVLRSRAGRAACRRNAARKVM